MNTLKFFFFLIITSSLMSCVSMGKFRTVESSLLRSETELIDKRKQVQELMKDTLNYGVLYRSMVKQVKELESYNTYSQDVLYKQLNQLQEKYDILQSSNSANVDMMNKMQIDLAKKTEENENLNKEYVPIKKMIKEQKDINAGLLLFTGQSLSGFDGEGVTISTHEGNVVINVAEEVLFQSAGYRIKSKGNDLLLQLGNAMSVNNSFNIVVEGHTDNIPLSGSRDNWDLSVLRATEVARVLMKGGVAPNRITASGKGQYEPIEDNTTADGRKRNRRVEIILVPDKSRLDRIVRGN